MGPYRQPDRSGMKKQASPSVGAAVEVAVAEMSDAVAPTSRSCREGRAASDPALELIEEIYREQAGRFRRVAAAIVESAEAAEDVVQEAFASAVARRGSFRGSGAASAWIWRIVVNGALSRQRRGRLERRLTEWLKAGRNDTEDRRANDDSFRALVARLPERQRTVLFLRYYADLDYAAIAEVLSIRPGTVGKLLHDARATLRAALGDEDG
jgi:RNA polymerase sigma factor (sigma-70 family)